MAQHQSIHDKIRGMATMTLLGVTLQSQSNDPFTLSAEADKVLAGAVARGTLTDVVAGVIRGYIRDEIVTLYGQMLPDNPTAPTT